MEVGERCAIMKSGLGVLRGGFGRRFMGVFFEG